MCMRDIVPVAEPVAGFYFADNFDVEKSSSLSALIVTVFLFSWYLKHRRVLFFIGGDDETTKILKKGGKTQWLN